MSDKIKVRITANQRVYYNQIVEMTPKEWAEIKNLKSEDAAQSLEGWLDLTDIENSTDIDSDDFEAMVVDDNGKPVQPIDRYD